MEYYYIFFLGVIVFSLHVPGLIIPKKHRKLGFQFIQNRSNIRFIGLSMLAIGAGAILVSPNFGFTKWFLILFGIYQILSGLFLLIYPKYFLLKIERLISGSIKTWILRAIIKCSVAAVLVIWGGFHIFS